MHGETCGIVFRQTKTLNSRRMILLFSEDFGKISAGTSISEKGKSRSALAMRPFTLSRFDITENKGYLNIKNAETIKSYYRIGDDLDKFANASYVLEFTEKLLPEAVRSRALFSLLTNYLDILETRKKSFDTLTLAFLVKAMQISGVAPQLKTCIICGEENTPVFFHMEDAGFICENCVSDAPNNGHNTLLYKINFDIVNVLNFLLENPLECVNNLEIKPELSGKIREIIKEYTAYHLDIGNMKSEALLNT